MVVSVCMRNVHCLDTVRCSVQGTRCHLPVALLCGDSCLHVSLILLLLFVLFVSALHCIRIIVWSWHLRELHSSQFHYFRHKSSLFWLFKIITWTIYAGIFEVAPTARVFLEIQRWHHVTINSTTLQARIFTLRCSEISLQQVQLLPTEITSCYENLW